MTLRWFAAAIAYAGRQAVPRRRSDFLYSVLLIAALCRSTCCIGLTVAACGDSAAAAGAHLVAAFGPDLSAPSTGPGNAGSLAAYAPIWRDLTRWSLLGVVLTEMTANAHAYLVTFISGPGVLRAAGAGIAGHAPGFAGAAALPDMERPAMARAIAAGDSGRCFPNR